MSSIKLHNLKFLRILKEKKRNAYKGVLTKFNKINSEFDSNDFYVNKNINYISKNFDNSSKMFSKNRWAYIKNAIKPKFYSELIKDWPNKNFLLPYPTEHKIQDVGFRYSPTYSKSRLENTCKYINNFPSLKEFYRYLISKNFAERIKEFLEIKEEMQCSFISTRAATEGSFLSFHMDGVGGIKEFRRKAINIVWHINGFNGLKNGGLCLSSNKNIISEWPKGLIHESSQLQNSCFIYDTSHDLGYFHGYPPMNKNTFRWVITSQFLPSKLI